MSKREEQDRLDALRVANPVDDDRLSSASLARVRARVHEDLMRTPSVPRASPRARVAGIAAAAAVVALALVAISRPAGDPGLAPGRSAGPGAAACVEPYTGPGSLTGRQFAFDGTVTAIDGDRVTFSVNDAFRGVSGASVTLEAPGMTGMAITTAGGPNLAVGARYLVAGDDRFAWPCGYTQPYDAEVAASWAAALGA